MFFQLDDLYITSFLKQLLLNHVSEKKYEVFLINNFYLWLKIHTLEKQVEIV